MTTMQEYPFGSGLVVGFVSLVAVLFAASRLIRKTSPYPLPPGPPGEPILGHLRTVPVERPELYYEQLAKEYSECFPLLRRRTAGY